MIYGSDILKNIGAYTESPQRNPAVHACCMAARRAKQRVQEATPGEKDTYDATEAAVIAYRDAMPSLEGYENVRNYIACVAHGMLVGVIDPIEGPKLLYAAQVALSAIPRAPKHLKDKGMPQKTHTPPPSPAVTT